MIGFRNRLAVLLDWALAYLTYQRSSRIIMEEPQYEEPLADAPDRGAARSHAPPEGVGRPTTTGH